MFKKNPACWALKNSMWHCAITNFFADVRAVFRNSIESLVFLEKLSQALHDEEDKQKGKEEEEQIFRMLNLSLNVSNAYGFRVPGCFTPWPASIKSFRKWTEIVSLSLSRPGQQRSNHDCLCLPVSLWATSLMYSS
jgi:hypothetical protein